MIDNFKFYLQTQLEYGVGQARKIGDFLAEKSFQDVVVVGDEGVANNSPYFDELITIIKVTAKKTTVQVVRGTEEPDYDYLDEIATRIRGIDKIDLIVGIGGGSCLDITKAVAILKNNAGKGIDYRGFDKIQNPGIPTLAIPTTAGTGSEVTNNAVFTDKKEMKKLGINGRFMNATYAILDAEGTISCPYSVALSSGIDALTHALESFTCQKANALSRTFSKEAFCLLYNALPCLVDDPHNRQKRQELLLGSYLAGAALFNSGSGIAGALSYPIGVHFNVPHGIGGGIFLESVIEYNILKGYSYYADLLSMIDNEEGLTIDRKNKKFFYLMRGLFERLNVPKYLDNWGITKNNVEHVGKLMLPLQAAFDQNPIPFSAATDASKFLRMHVKP
jgi:alcohol dehydrogenase class IV